MTATAPRRFAPLLLATLLLSGCGRKEGGAHKADDGHAHDDGESHEAESKVAFKEGRGLELSPEVVAALGLKTVAVAERPLAAEMKLVAQVFATRPEVLATASMSEESAAVLEKHSIRGAKVARIDRAALAATRMVDVVFVLDRAPPPALGDFIPLTLAGESVTTLAVPASAVLDAALGTFVYVVNGGHYLRTPVKTGRRSGDFVAIADGLSSGAVVVTTAVEQLWLAELRLTKGGGHSH